MTGPAEACPPYPAILFTNNSLALPGGTESVVRDLAGALHAKGYPVMAYSPRLGDVAQGLRSSGVAVVDDLRRLPRRPDLIHGHHHEPAMTAMLTFPEVPAIFACHGIDPWQEDPPRFPTIAAYTAVSRATRRKVADECGVPLATIALTLNFVDGGRFPPRPPLPQQARSVLVMSRRAGPDDFDGVVARTCADRGMTVSVLGAPGTLVSDPSPPMRRADVVIAAGRSALEAMATGCAVVVADRWGIAGMVTPANFDELRAGNFGSATATQALTGRALALELDRYEPAAAAAVSARVRGEAAIEDAVDQWEAIYRSVLAGWQPPDAAELTLAAAHYISEQGRRFDRLGDLSRALSMATMRADQFAAAARSEQLERGRLEGEARELRRSHAALQRVLDSRTGVHGSAAALWRDSAAFARRGFRRGL